MVKVVCTFYYRCKKGLGGVSQFVSSSVRREAEIPLNKGTATYSKGMNWLFLAHTSFPGLGPYT